MCFNSLPKRLSLLIISISIPFIIQAQTLIADYPLITNSNDATGNFGPITYGSSATQAPNACGDGTSTGKIQTPVLASLLNNSNFQVSMTFKLNGVESTSHKPIFILDYSYRAFGVVVNNTGAIGLLWNNNQTSFSSTILTIGQTYTLTAKYVAPYTEIYLDEQLILFRNIGSPLAFNPSNTTSNLVNYNGNNGQYGYSCLSNIKVYSGGVKLTPYITNITSSKNNGTYKVGDVIDIQTTFSENVDVTGTPQLTLETGTTDRTAAYFSGSGTSELTFRYTVQAGDVSSDLTYIASSPLALNGGTIKGTTNNNASLISIPAPTATGSLGANKAIIVDGVVPTATISSTTGTSGSSTANSPLNFTATFSETVTGFTSSGITVTNGTISSGPNGTGTTYTFSVTPTTANSATSVTINANAAKDGAGNNNTVSGSYSLTYTPPLPINLLSFTAKFTGNLVKLDWATASEQNNRSFALWRSGDNQKFSQIGTFEGHGTTQARNDYNFLDRSPLSGVNYYKLTQIDNDGKITELGIKSVDIKLFNANQVTIYPNPATNLVSVKFTGHFSSIALIDLNGKLIEKAKVSNTANSHDFNISALSAGTYFIKLYSEAGISTYRFIKI